MVIAGLRGWEAWAVVALAFFVVLGMVGRNAPSIRNLGGTPQPGQGTPNMGGRGGM